MRGLIAAFLADGGDPRVEVSGVVPRRLDTSRPTVTCTGERGLADMFTGLG